MACKILKQKIHDTLRAGSFPDPDYFIDVFDDELIVNTSASLSSAVNLTFMNTNVRNEKTGYGKTSSKCYPKMNLNVFLGSSQ